MAHSIQFSLSQPARTIVQEVMYLQPNYIMYPSLKILVFAVRSFGIIGGGAVLFGASAIAGQAIINGLGEIQKPILALLYMNDFKT